MIPGEAWAGPNHDYREQGFDANLVYTEPMNRFVFDPFVVFQHGTWESCPCAPGSEVTISASGLASSRMTSDTGAYELNGVEALINGKPALLHLVTPSQIDFALPSAVTGPSATVEVLRGGVSAGRSAVAIGDQRPSNDVYATSARIELNAAGAEAPAVHLITTPLSFAASVTVMVEERAGDATPLRLMLWNPRNFSSLDVVFDSGGKIQAEFHEGPGRVAKQLRLMTYDIGSAYQVQVQWERGEWALVAVSGGGDTREFEIGPSEAPALFDAYRPSLTVSAAANTGASSVALTEYSLELLPSRFTTLRIDDPVVPPLMAALTLLGLILLAASLTPLAAVRGVRRSAAGAVGSGRRFIGEHPIAAAASAAFLIGYIAFNAAVFSLGSHPFDMGSETTWSYIASEYGITNLYYVSQTATLAGVWNGMPYHEAVFPYGVGMSYYFWAIGEAHLLLFGHASPHAMSMQVMVKSFNLAFLLADAWLVFAIVRHLRPASRHLPWILAVAILLNPAVIFDTAVWGETESVVLFPLLASLLAAFKERPGIAWTFLAVAFLTKQTVLLPILGIAVWYLLRFDIRRNLEGFSAGMVAVLMLILPFTLNGYPPSVAIDPALAGAWVHGAGGAEKAFQIVSYDAFNIWTLITPLADGASGLGRFQAPDYEPRLASLSYHALGLLALSASVAGVIVLWVVRRPRIRASADSLLLGVGLIFLAELFLPTQTLSRYYVFVAVFATLALSGRSPLIAGVSLGAVTLTALVGQWGSLALVLQDFPSHAPELAPANNELSRVMVDIFTSDVFITTGALLNGLSLVLLAFACQRSAVATRPAETPTERAVKTERTAIDVTIAPLVRQQ